MLKRLIPAIAVLCLAGPVRADEKPPCETLAQSIASAKDMANKERLGFITLDDAEAKAFLDAVNNVGEPTSFSADHLGIFVAPANGVAVILLADGPCGGFRKMIRMPLKPVLDAYSKARGLAM